MEFRASEFEGYVSRLMEEERAPGLAVAVVAGGQVVYAKGFGHRDEAGRLPVTPDTIFGVASLTKSVTALAVMRLCEEHKLSLDDPVKRYLPGFDVPGGGDDITIHHFLSHTSGLPPLPALGHSIRAHTVPDRKEDREERAGRAQSPGEADPAPMPPIATYDELLGYLKTGDFSMLGRPGEFCSYSNDAYALLGAIIEKASGEIYEDYVTDHILRPLGMRRSTFSLEWALSRADVTTLFYKEETDSGEEVRSSNNWQVAPPYLACGWLKSTALDMAKYIAMYVSGGTSGGSRVLSDDSIAKMCGRHYVYSRDRWYGYGWSTRPDYHGFTLVEHSGGLKGVNSNMGFVPERGIGAVVLCNLSGGPAGRVWLAAVNLLLGLPVDAPRSVYRKAPWPAELLPRLTGRFKSGEGGEAVLLERGGALVAAMGKKEYEVFMDREDLGVYTAGGVDQEVKFYFGPDGRAWAIGHGGRVVRKTGEV